MASQSTEVAVQLVVNPQKRIFPQKITNIEGGLSQMSKSWRDRIVAALNDMADADFQKRSWTGLGPEVSSYDEVICALYDDALFNKFVEDNRHTMSNEQIKKIEALNQEVSKVDDEKFRNSDPLEIIYSPLWRRIQKLAGQVAASLV